MAIPMSPHHQVMREGGPDHALERASMMKRYLIDDLKLIERMIHAKYMHMGMSMMYMTQWVALVKLLELGILQVII